MIRKLSSDSGAGSPVRTAEDFVAELRRLRTQVGDPSLRQLHRIAGKRIAEAPGGHRLDPLSPSTTSEILSGKRLPRPPRPEFVESYVTACLLFHGLDEAAVDAEVARWAGLRHSLAEPEEPPVLEEPRPYRRMSMPLIAGVFVAGLAAGFVISRAWPAPDLTPAALTASTVPSLDAADPCLVPGAAPPTGRDVLRLPPAGRPNGSWWVNDPNYVVLDTDGRRFSAGVTAGTKRPGDAIVIKGDVTLTAGTSYALAFNASADLATTIRVRVQDNEPPTFTWSYDREVPVSRSPCLHVYRFVARKSSTHSELTFQVGGRPGDFRLRVQDVSLIESPTQ